MWPRRADGMRTRLLSFAVEANRVTAPQDRDLREPTQSGHLIGEMERLAAVVRKCSRCRCTSAARRCMNSSGDITMCVVQSRYAVLSLSTTCPATLHLHPLVGQHRAGDVATQQLPLSRRRWLGANRMVLCPINAA